MSAPGPATLPATAPVVDDENPWPGLLAFNEAFRKYFFGRGAELDDLFRRVRQETLTVLYAQSGLGKTSLLQAGLFHRLREEGFLPVPIRLDYGGTTQDTQSRAEAPQRQILRAIAGAIADRGAGEASNPQTAPGAWEYLHDIDLMLLDETGSPLTPVLVFDQFEELFTLGAGRRDDGRFADQVVQLLGDLIENRPPRALERAMAQDPGLVDRYDFTRGNYRILLSLREDYLPHLHGLRGEIPSIILNNLRLTRFNRRQALEVVERPAAQRGLVTRKVAEAIVRTVAGLDTTAEPGGPPPRTGELRPGDPDSRERLGERLEVDPALLSLFCRELNGLRRGRGEPVISLELVAGSKESVLRDFYLGCFRDLSPPPEPGVKAFVEDYLLTSKGYRDRLTLERATEILVIDYHGRAEELSTLVDRRLLQVEERGKTPQIELTHDVLAPVAMRERLERVRNQELQEEERRRQEELRRAAQEEHEAKEREAAAAAALAAAQRQQRRTLALLGVVAAAAGIAVFFAFRAAAAGREAERNRVAAVKAEAEALVERDRQASLADSLRLQQIALTESTAVAKRARLRAENLFVQARAARDTTARMLTMVSLERTRSDSLVSDFCAYTMDLVNTLGDSSATNPLLKDAYSTLLEKSDTAAGRMARRTAGSACTQQLGTRVVTVSTQVRRSRDAQDSRLAGAARVRAARSLGLRALGAVRSLALLDDTTSRRVAAASYYDLVYEFHLMSQRDSTLRDTTVRIAGEGVIAALHIDPARDSGAFNRPSRMRHYAAIALTGLGRADSARRVLDAALESVARGQARSDQDQDDLMFTESQLRMRLGEVDSARNRPGPALQEFGAAVRIARARLDRFKFTENRRWLAVAHRALGDMAEAFGRDAEALAAFDSSGANWQLYANRQKDQEVHDTAAAVSALHSLSVVRIAQAGAALRIGRPQAALAHARAAVEAQEVAADLRPTDSNLRAIGGTYGDATSLFESTLPAGSADSLYEAWFRRDSATVAAGLAAGSNGASGRGLVHLLDQIVGSLARRFRADTVGKGVAERARLQRAYGVSTLRYREPRVWLLREIARRSGSHGARDSLGTALGDVSWSYLLAGRPREAAEAAAEGLRMAPEETYIIPNWVNAALIRGPDGEAEALFRRFAGQEVESPKIRFECAMQRDLLALREADVATERHVATFQRFLGDLQLPCLRPIRSATP